MTTDPADLLALGPLDERDGEVLRAVREAYSRADPVPSSLVDRVKFALTLDDLEVEVARLQRDAVPELVARSDEVVGREDLLRARSVTFTSDIVTTMVTISPIDATAVRIDGWAAPGARLAVELRVGDTSHHVVADEDGRFVFESVGHGMVQLVLRPPADTDGGAHPVITPAIEI